MWAVYCLSKGDAHELKDKPLNGTPGALKRGFASVVREYQHDGYAMHVLRITPAGRDALERAMA